MKGLGEGEMEAGKSVYQVTALNLNPVAGYSNCNPGAVWRTKLFVCATSPRAARPSQRPLAEVFTFSHLAVLIWVVRNLLPFAGLAERNHPQSSVLRLSKRDSSNSRWKNVSNFLQHLVILSKCGKMCQNFCNIWSFRSLWQILKWAPLARPILWRWNV